MTQSCWGLEFDEDSRPYKQNVKAVWIVSGVSILIVFWYAAASYEAWYRTKKSSAEIQYFQANSLSGALVSLVAILLLYTSFPQPIEATLSIVLALSQASALGWLDLPPTAAFHDVLCAKIPDLFALGLTLWVTWDAKEKYLETGDNRSQLHSPFGFKHPWFPFAILSVVNEFAMVGVYRVLLVSRRGEREVRGASAQLLAGLVVFFLSSWAGSGIGWTFATWGCHPFDVALGAAPCAVASGAIFSCFQVYRRLHDLREANQEAVRSRAHTRDSYGPLLPNTSTAAPPSGGEPI